MDPSIFFGRTRVTRQALKSKQQTPSEDNTNCEVNKTVHKQTRKIPVKHGKSKSAAAQKENEVERESPRKRTTQRGKQPVKTIKNNLNGLRSNCKPTKKSQKVQFEEPDDGPSHKSPSKGEKSEDSAPTGPVYLNVHRSDVVGDPLHEYDFPCGSDSSPEKIKKKVVRKAKPAKKAAGVVMWDPSKRPINVKVKPAKKTTVLVKDLTTTSTNKTAKQPLHVSQPSKATCTSEKMIEKPVSVTVPAPSKPQQISSATNTSIISAKCVTSTPVSRETPLKKVPNSTVAAKPLRTAPVSQGQALSVPSIRVSLTPEESCTPRSPSVFEDFHSESMPTTDSPNHTSFNDQSSSKVKSAQVSSRHSCTSSLRKLVVRESPSFRVSCEAPESPQRSSLLGMELPRQVDAVTSTPVTRARKNNGEALKSTAVNFAKPDSNRKDSCPLERVSAFAENISDGNMSGIFDDIPRTSVVPTRMFSTHRGTIYIPEGQNAPKRKMPDISPINEQSSSRVTVVKFPAPKTSFGVEQCFGFDNVDEDVTFVPQLTNNNVNVVKKPQTRKPSLSIEEAKAILRGQCKLASPANVTPRSIQTKLTDFVSSTPARVVAISNQDVLTPTPVPLFDEDQLEREFPSPFSRPSRRSYDRFKPVKRVACGDEVHSGDEEDTTEQNNTESTMPIKKKSKSYKRTKKPKESKLDAWANQLASHFDEVEQVELELE